MHELRGGIADPSVGAARSAAPPIVSVKIVSQPAARRASSCRARVCSTVDTRALPTSTAAPLPCPTHRRARMLQKSA